MDLGLRLVIQVAFLRDPIMEGERALAILLTPLAAGEAGEVDVFGPIVVAIAALTVASVAPRSRQ